MPKETIKIRRFIQDKDEENWLRIRNEAYKEYDDFRPATIEDMKKAERSPNFDPTGMFIAEYNGQPVGIINAFIDKKRKEKKGFIRTLGVLPEFRRKGIGKTLMKKAIESLKERGMEEAETWTQEDKPACKKLFELLGFKLIRVFSTMRRDLKTIPSDIGEHTGVTLRSIKMDDLEDIKLLCWLENETFKEHFDFRPKTLEEIQYWIQEKPWCDIMKYYFAYLKDKPAGYVGVGIDSKFVKHTGIKRGYIMTIGVLKPYRNQGIGTRVILEGMKFLKSQGMVEAELGVDDANPTKAIELYKKVGFKIIRKDLTYLKKI